MYSTTDNELQHSVSPEPHRRPAPGLCTHYQVCVSLRPPARPVCTGYPGELHQPVCPHTARDDQLHDHLPQRPGTVRPPAGLALSAQAGSHDDVNSWFRQPQLPDFLHSSVCRSLCDAPDVRHDHLLAYRGCGSGPLHLAAVHLPGQVYLYREEG